MSRIYLQRTTVSADRSAQEIIREIAARTALPLLVEVAEAAEAVELNCVELGGPDDGSGSSEWNAMRAALERLKEK